MGGTGSTHRRARHIEPFSASCQMYPVASPESNHTSQRYMPCECASFSARTSFSGLHALAFVHRTSFPAHTCPSARTTSSAHTGVSERTSLSRLARAFLLHDPFRLSLWLLVFPLCGSLSAPLPFSVAVPPPILCPSQCQSLHRVCGQLAFIPSHPLTAPRQRATTFPRLQVPCHHSRCHFCLSSLTSPCSA